MRVRTELLAAFGLAAAALAGCSSFEPYVPPAGTTARITPLQAREIVRRYGGYCDRSSVGHTNVRYLDIVGRELIIKLHSRDGDLSFPLKDMTIKAQLGPGHWGAVEINGYRFYDFQNISMDARSYAAGFADALSILKEEASNGRDAEAEMRMANEARAAKEKADFEKMANDYRDTAVKPELPEEARRFKIKAETSVRDKDFVRAAERYKEALDVSPWWPEGHYNRALVLAETGGYAGAIDEMKRFLILVTEGPTARTAKDKIYAWEDKAK